ncbi:uncharacterized protein LOC124354102 isoform X1 [Homalodisca vitripennis]|uniref:uncharacterized protein LOC124354102 isoform X1 n=1 Tax=Homalodisca vitripennis TaxID=197043 RepID=UPI001EEBF9A3|nr:uncharacterized protein LOC124354102 isoform X1 [Homalodisca vitripennis]XP_046660266.1 uncharacterized protein LOC124354102 isoform X1 [Homalodisca vitripennis]XP_046660267.1 uncharacterized protein LOC124354102 isoform X1 [Homalodisca vitripennis]XP_046660268.1 uncharacterized protein LOC124354102 isoform X1 [Homalodisca vitripennis]XP_046660269.1 uncharacterized protein LOC124354102 isoform X1 [Homalodisca vitripennis]XP_046660270.1 uncharacterized protein LOC124354102 isoform X1 [Homalo
MEDFLKTLDKGIIFGHVKGSDFQTLETERLKQEEKLKEEFKKIEKLRKVELEEKELQELEDHLLALEEQKFDLEFKRNHCLIQNTSHKSVGRGGMMRQLIKEKELIGNTIKGRGRYSKSQCQQMAQNPIFKKEEMVRNFIRQGPFRGEALQSNNYQMQVWQEKPFTQVSSSSSTDSSEQFEDAQNSLSSATDSSEQFEVAQKSSSSPQPLKDPQSASSSVESFKSANPLKSSTTPPLYTFKEICPPLEKTFPDLLCKDDFPPLPVSSNQRKPRKTRIAAKFSNMYLNEEVQSPTEDRLSILTSSAPRLIPTVLPESKFVSINDLRPSQRIISSNLLKPSDIQKSSQFGTNLNENNLPVL